jgi:UDPglucose 6-dehydrogenase
VLDHSSAGSARHPQDSADSSDTQGTLPRISVVGLGKLGSPLAAVFAHRGFDVIGLDLNSSFVEALNAGQAPVPEPMLQGLIDANRARLRATQDWNEAVDGSDVSFLIVPTPSGDDGFFSNDYLISALRSLGAAIARKSSYHLVVITSTVMPGATGSVLKDVLEQASGRKVGPDMGLCYNPEFIALGSVVRDMLHPDMILIGQSDDKAGDMLEAIYRQSAETKPEYMRMNFVNAELAKLSVNTFVTTKISYANMIGEMCDRLPGGDAAAVAWAIGADSRIGRKYLKPAIGFGVPCFPRDNKAFVALGQKLGVNCDLAIATDSVNTHQIARMRQAVGAFAARGARVAVLGASYKPSTPVVEESQGIMLANALAADSFTVTLCDPMGLPAARRLCAEGVSCSDDLESSVREADVVIVTTICHAPSLLKAPLPKR